jgi:hypothetical protein
MNLLLSRRWHTKSIYELVVGYVNLLVIEPFSEGDSAKEVAEDSSNIDIYSLYRIQNLLFHNSAM